MFSRDNNEGVPIIQGEDWNDNPMGFFESAKTQFNYSKKATVPNAASALPIEIDKRNWKIQQEFMAGREDPKLWILPEDQWTNGSSAGSARAAFANIDFEKAAVYLKAKGMDIQTADEVEANLREGVRQAKEQVDRSGSLAGKFVGGAIAEGTDPINMVVNTMFGGGTLVSTAHKGARFGKLLRMGKLSAEGAAAEAATVPMRVKGAELYGHDYGVKEAALDITMGAVGLPALDAVLQGGRKVLKVIGSRNAATGLKKNFPTSPEANQMADQLSLGGDKPVDEFLQEMQDAQRTLDDGPPNPKIDEPETDFIGPQPEAQPTPETFSGVETPSNMVETPTAPPRKPITRETKLFDADGNETPEFKQAYEETVAKRPDLEVDEVGQQEAIATIQACLQSFA